MYCFWPNICIQHIEASKTFVDNGQPVTHQTRIKIKLSLQVRNTCNSQKINQRNICRSRPNRIDTETRIRINHKKRLRNAQISITLTDRINPLKIFCSVSFSTGLFYQWVLCFFVHFLISICDWFLFVFQCLFCLGVIYKCYVG